MPKIILLIFRHLTIAQIMMLTGGAIVALAGALGAIFDRRPNNLLRLGSVLVALGGASMCARVIIVYKLRNSAGDWLSLMYLVLMIAGNALQAKGRLQLSAIKKERVFEPEEGVWPPPPRVDETTSGERP